MTTAIRNISARLTELPPWHNNLRHAGQTLQHKAKKLLRSPVTWWISGGLFVTATITSAALFYWPRAIAFSYSGTNCITNPTFFPGFVTSQPNPHFQAVLSKNVSLGKFALYSHKTCLTLLDAPQDKTPETLTLRAMGSSFLQKNIRVTPDMPPQLQAIKLDKPISAQQPLTFQLERADHIFDYRVLINTQELGCSKKDQHLNCDIPQLRLAQGTPYQLSLQRLFKGKVHQTLLEQSITTVEPVRVTASSIAEGQLIYSKPTEIVLTLNKTATSFSGLHVTAGQKRQEVPVTAELKDATLVVRFSQALPRNTPLSLTIEQLVATDGGYLTNPFALNFKTSGGPKVIGVNIGSSRVQLSSAIVLTFDSTLAATQAHHQFVQLEVNGGAAPMNVTAQGRTITLRPTSPLPRCTAFVVKVLDGLQSSFGVTGGSAWQFRSRTTCQTAFSIGTSVQGRSIIAYRFGNGPSTIIYVGATHGNEQSSAYILNRWIDYLEANADRIPAHRTIIVIPVVNPDGFAAGRRTNAHNVDLNRNFPANNWKAGVVMPDKSYLPQGGGAKPLSEPESSALANFVLSQNPRLVLTYHAVGGVVVPNDSDDSQALAAAYARQSSVGYMSNASTGSFFEYDTTGAFEDWLHDKYGIPALLVELSSYGGNEFSGHSTAMWSIATIP